MSLGKQFDFNKLEKDIYNQWEKSNCFKPVKNKDTYSIMMPPPNVTGSLHMGHALTFTIQDILIRYNRMQGKEVLWQAGTDHAGIATQMVVENELSKKNIKRIELGREKFIEKVWEWKKDSGGKINNQLRRLGASADWSRERFTMDEGLSKAVKKVFVQLYNDKIIYKDKRLVNWDPKLLTAISDLEVEQKDIEGTLWYIKYPLNKDKYIIIATTRPETMLGDTAVAVNPNDERYKDLIGKYCTLPLTEKNIQIIGDEHADPTKGSGAVKITPAHDFNDFEVGKRHNLEFINIFDQFAKLNKNVPSKYYGMDRFEARKTILEDLKNLDLLVKEEKQIIPTPFGDRSGVIIEPWLTDQWFCDAKKLSIDPIDNVKKGKTKFVPKQWEKTFFNWMENIQPWCISRQLWWGHQIPAWYGPDEKIFVANDLNIAQIEANSHYGKEVLLRQDEDVLDTWFSSALWTFSTLDWPDNSYEINKFYPSNVLVTGFDIIFFWVARMMMMGSYFIKKTPFKYVYIHPLIRDEKGQKMSKSKGNIIDPLDLLDKYGADTLRFSLTALINPGRDVKLSESRIKGYKSLTNKIWNAANYLIMNDCVYDKNLNTSQIILPLNQWIINELSSTSEKINNNIENFLFHEVANDIYHFIWNTYCDWYIEFSKTLFKDNSDKSKETKKVAIWVFIEILKISHSIMPFITERLWQILVKDSFLMNQIFIKHQINDSYKNSQYFIDNLINIITSVRNLRSELNISYKTPIDINFSNDNNFFLKFLLEYENELKRLLKLNNITYNINPNKIEGSAYLLVSKTTISIPLKNVVNMKIELKKLNQKKEKEQNTLNDLELKLANINFLKKAPENVINQYKKQVFDIKSSLEKIKQIIDTIS